jgi:hypothetical protein
VKPTPFLRAASLLTFVHAVLHTAGGVFGPVMPGAQQAAVLAMKTNQFQILGLTRSYWDFNLGEGLAITIFLLVEAVVFWQLGSLARKSAAPSRPILAAFLVGYLCLAVNSWRYFFAPPMIGEILIALCLGLAILSPRPTANA